MKVTNKKIIFLTIAETDTLPYAIAVARMTQLVTQTTRGVVPASSQVRRRRFLHVLSTIFFSTTTAYI